MFYVESCYPVQDCSLPSNKQMYNNPDNYLDRSVADLFRLLANCFILFVATCLCQYSQRYWLIFKDPNESPYMLWGGDIQLFNPSIVLL